MAGLKVLTLGPQIGKNWDFSPLNFFRGGGARMNSRIGDTRMLAINASIPNLTVARLQQFLLPQVRIQTERPTYIGVD